MKRMILPKACGFALATALAATAAQAGPTVDFDGTTAGEAFSALALAGPAAPNLPQPGKISPPSQKPPRAPAQSPQRAPVSPSPASPSPEPPAAAPAPAPQRAPAAPAAPAPRIPRNPTPISPINPGQSPAPTPNTDPCWNNLNCDYYGPPVVASPPPYAAPPPYYAPPPTVVAPAPYVPPPVVVAPPPSYSYPSYPGYPGYPGYSSPYAGQCIQMLADNGFTNISPGATAACGRFQSSYGISALGSLASLRGTITDQAMDSMSYYVAPESAGCVAALVSNGYTNITDGAVAACGRFQTPYAVTAINALASERGSIDDQAISAMAAYVTPQSGACVAILVGNGYTSITDGAVSACGRFRSQAALDALSALASQRQTIPDETLYAISNY